MYNKKELLLLTMIEYNYMGMVQEQEKCVIHENEIEEILREIIEAKYLYSIIDIPKAKELIRNVKHKNIGIDTLAAGVGAIEVRVEKILYRQKNDLLTSENNEKSDTHNSFKLFCR
jgi:hypothetical protein